MPRKELVGIWLPCSSSLASSWHVTLHLHRTNTFPSIPHWLFGIKARAPEAIHETSGVAVWWNHVNIWWCMACWEVLEALALPEVTPGCFAPTQPRCVPRSVGRGHRTVPTGWDVPTDPRGSMQQSRAISQPLPNSCYPSACAIGMYTGNLSILIHSGVGIAAPSAAQLSTPLGKVEGRS